MAVPQGRPNSDAMDGGMDGRMDIVMDRQAFCMHGTYNNFPPGGKYISLVGIPRAFQGWDEKRPTKSQDKFSVTLCHSLPISATQTQSVVK